MADASSSTMYNQERRIAFLQEVACETLNMSPPLRSEIRKRDAILRVEEEERMGMDFYRAAAASRKTRTKLLDEVTIMFLGDMMNLNKDAEEARQKADKALVSYKAIAKTNARLSRRIMIIRKLCSKLKLFAIVMETRLSVQEKTFVTFLCNVANEMHLDKPINVLNRHTTLRFMHQELYREYQEKVTALNDQREQHAAYVKEMNHQIVVRFNEIVSLQITLGHIKSKVAVQEIEISKMVTEASTTTLLMFQLHTSIQDIYNHLHTFRGRQPEHVDLMTALDYIESSFQNLVFVLESIQQSELAKPRSFLFKYKRYSTQGGRDSLKKQPERKQRGSSEDGRQDEGRFSSFDDKSTISKLADSLPSITITNSTNNALTGAVRRNAKNGHLVTGFPLNESVSAHCRLPDIASSLSGGL